MNTIAIIAGVGFRFNNSFNNTENVFTSNNVKINIGTATAKLLAEKGYDLILLSKTQSKLDKVKTDLLQLFPNRTIYMKAIDILDEKQVEEFAKGLSADCTYSYIHSAGLSAGGYKLDNDNPYLPIEKTPIDLPVYEFTAVVKSLAVMVKGLMTVFKRQNSTKIIVIDSMSSIRSYPFGFSHSSAKAGLHNAVRSLSLELTPQNIFISEINPGMVDTGGYDSEEVKNAVKQISKTFGYEYEELPLMPPESIAEAVLLCFESKAHILNIDLVSQGQFPHIGA